MGIIPSPQEQARGIITLLHLAEAETYVWVSPWKTDENGRPRKEFKVDRQARQLRLTASGAETDGGFNFHVRKDYEGRMLAGLSATPQADPFLWGRLTGVPWRLYAGNFVVVSKVSLNMDPA